MNQLTQERLKELLDYDSETGVFTNKVNRGRVRVGDVAGATQAIGYVIIGVDGTRYYAHRLAWLYVHGKWPVDLIDHKDGDKANNRIGNLREASDAQNSENIGKARANNISRLLGVSRHVEGLYFSRISVNKQKRHLGYFKTAEEAHSAYLKAKSELHKFSNRIKA